MPKDASYHQAAIQYNDELAGFAEELAERLEHEEVQRWSRAVAKQHRYHSEKHSSSLQKIKEQDELIEEYDHTTGVEELDNPPKPGLTTDHGPVATNAPDLDTSAPAPAASDPDDAEPIDVGPDPSQAAQPVANTGQEA